MKALQAAGLILITLLLMFFGSARPSYVKHANKVDPDVIVTRGLQMPVEYAGMPVSRMTPGEAFWRVADTDDWLLLNGPAGTAICPAVLGDFGLANANERAMTPDAIRRIAFDFKDKPVQLQVFVPRFKSAPTGLAECPGLTYDYASGMVKLGAKRIAYLSPAQPQLVPTSTSK